MIMGLCLALEAIMKDQVEQLNKIGDAASAIGIDIEAVQKRKLRDCMFVTSVHLSFYFRYIDLSLCGV